MGLLPWAHHRLGIEQPQPLRLVNGRFHAGRVAHPLPEHLKPAADACDSPREFPDRPEQPLLCEETRGPPWSICCRGGSEDRGLRGRGRARCSKERHRAPPPAHRSRCNWRFAAAAPRRYRIVSFTGPRSPVPGSPPLQRHAVFFRNTETCEPGNHPQDRHTGPLLHELDARGEERWIAAELVDDNTFDLVPFVRVRSSRVPTIWANTPPRSMSATRTTGRRPCRPP